MTSGAIRDDGELEIRGIVEELEVAPRVDLFDGDSRWSGGRWLSQSRDGGDCHQEGDCQGSGRAQVRAQSGRGHVSLRRVACG